MRKVLPLTKEIALLDAAQTRDLEQRASAALPPHALMHRAGAAVARLALAIAPNARHVWIAAGPGNNGGDGLMAAVHLLGSGKSLEVTLLGDAAALPSDAADALVRARAAGVSITTNTTPTRTPDLAIDALLGIGASRAPEGAMAECIRRVNALSCQRLAIDLPSGLHAITGNALGADCIDASHTLALLCLKPGLFTASGRDHAGTVWLDDLGTDGLTAAQPCAWLSGDLAEQKPRRHAQHKGSFGDVAIVGGQHGMTGAAILAARAAHAAGAGRIYVDLLDRSPATAQIDPLRPELMFRPDWLQSAPEVLARTTVACGCGGGDEVRKAMPRLLSSARRLVLDADALNALAADKSLADLLRARASRGLASVITPHPLEAARLLRITTAEVQSDRLHAARELASRYACVVVLKGSGTLIAAPEQVTRINATGNAALATAGTGDVLAGWLAGRWAQQPAGDEGSIAFSAARQSVAEHGAAAEPAPRGALRASDLIERLGSR